MFYELYYTMILYSIPDGVINEMEMRIIYN
jgi:hypothetical protein